MTCSGSGARFRTGGAMEICIRATASTMVRPERLPAAPPAPSRASPQGQSIPPCAALVEVGRTRRAPATDPAGLEASGRISP